MEQMQNMNTKDKRRWSDVKRVRPQAVSVFYVRNTFASLRDAFWSHGWWWTADQPVNLGQIKASHLCRGRLLQLQTFSSFDLFSFFFFLTAVSVNLHVSEIQLYLGCLLMGTGGILDTKTWGRLALTPRISHVTSPYEHICVRVHTVVTTYTNRHTTWGRCAQIKAAQKAHKHGRCARHIYRRKQHTLHTNRYIPSCLSLSDKMFGLLSVLLGLALSSSCLSAAASLRQIWSMRTCTLSRSSVRWDERKWEVLFFLWC